jgi:hypothetical protein
MPVKDVDLVAHLMNCPGAEVRQAEWNALQASAKPDVKPEPDAQPQ